MPCSPLGLPFYTTRAVLVRVLIALFIAVSLDPAVRMLTRRGMRRGLAVLVIFLVAGGLVAAFLVSVIPAMIHQFQALVHDFPGYFASLQERSLAFVVAVCDLIPMIGATLGAVPSVIRLVLGKEDHGDHHSHRGRDGGNHDDKLCR